VLLGSVVVRWPLVGVAAEFLAPSHLGSMADHSLKGTLAARLRSRGAAVTEAAERAGTPSAATAAGTEAGTEAGTAAGDLPDGEREPDAKAERHWRTDRRMMRAYGWLTLLWAATFLVRAAVQGFLYWRDEVALLGTSSLVLGLPVTALALVVTLWVVARLHRHRTA